MENTKEYNFEFEGNESDELMEFVIKTREGAFTEEVPQLADFTVKRFVIEEEDITLEIEDSENNILLFGISN